MDPRALEREIDGLYQLPPGEFTAARNALAKQGGAGAARIRALTKPPVAAWAVNQLYWQRRSVWDALVAAADEARRAHKSVLAGRSADIRSAGRVHEEAVDTALKATLALLRDAGQPATDATRQAIATTLRVLPGDETPGRLTTTLQPRGFEALAGLSIAQGGSKKASPPAPRHQPGPAARAKTPSAPEAKATARARAVVAAAERELRSAEHAAKREEFEVAKAAREERRAAETVEQARTALERAQAELEEAEKEAAEASARRSAAESRAHSTEAAVEQARLRLNKLPRP